MPVTFEVSSVMRKTYHLWTLGRLAPVGLPLVATLLLAGCNSHHQPVYQGKQGFRFTPPPGWVERARDDALPGKATHRNELPLPAIGVSGEERLLVRYDRLTSGHLAWLRVSVADLPSSTSIHDHVSIRSPGPNWKRELELESLQLSGVPAERIVFKGRWNDQEYFSETVAARHGEQVYFITASFPVSDDKAREQVRQAVAGATWK
jgi:hypothetical protein